MDGVDLGAGGPGDIQRVADVVEVAVSQEDGIDSGLSVLGLRTGWVAREPWVDQHRRPVIGPDTHCGVAQPGDFESSEFHPETPMSTYVDPIGSVRRSEISRTSDSGEDGDG
jgi:hypothetical protein